MGGRPSRLVRARCPSIRISQSSRGRLTDAPGAQLQTAGPALAAESPCVCTIGGGPSTHTGGAAGLSPAVASCFPTPPHPTRHLQRPNDAELQGGVAYSYLGGGAARREGGARAKTGRLVCLRVCVRVYVCVLRGGWAAPCVDARAPRVWIVAGVRKGSRREGDGPERPICVWRGVLGR